MKTSSDGSQMPLPESSNSGQLFQTGLVLGRLEAKLEALLRSHDLLIRILHGQTSGPTRRLRLKPTASSTATTSTVTTVAHKLSMEALTWGAGHVALVAIRYMLPLAGFLYGVGGTLLDWFRAGLRYLFSG